MTDDLVCPLCDGGCVDADLGPLLQPELAWFWRFLAAAADRRGDPHLTAGPRVSVTMPQDPAERAAAVGVIGGVALAGQRRAVSLPEVTDLVRRRGPLLTPGSVAAHAVRRPLARRAIESAERANALGRLADTLHGGLGRVTLRSRDLDADDVVRILRRTGALTRLLTVPDAARVVHDVIGILTALPPSGHAVDRRLLAERVLGDPHGLDEGTRVEVLARAVLAASGCGPAGARPRSVWAHVGVEWDAATGGIGAIGVRPAGWAVPPSVVVTVPPVELAQCGWPQPPEDGTWVFVTENPSVLTAARHLARAGHVVRLLCTSGTPSETEIAAMARLTEAGWSLAVRADFDEAGLRHVASLLAAADGVTPWRMATSDYLDSLSSPRRTPLPADARLESPWEPRLADVMRERGAAAFEEALITHLMADLARGVPGGSAST